MQGRLPLIIGILVVALGVIVYSATFVVHQTQQAAVLQFGAVKRVITEPGLHFKIPLIQNVRFEENRVLNLDPRAETVLLADQRRLVVNTFVRYRIDNLEQFIRVAISEGNLRSQLEPIVNNAVRTVLGTTFLPTILSAERDSLMDNIRERVNQETQKAGSNFGIDVLDVRIVRADLLPEVSKSVYERMKSERERDANEFRAQGNEQYQGITSAADREATVIRAEANREAEILRGTGDAERTRILSDAYGRDPEFFEFYRSMQAYEAAIRSDNSVLVMPTDNDFFRYFNDQRGGISVPAGAGTNLPRTTAVE